MKDSISIELRRVLESLPQDFFGSVEIGYQCGSSTHVRVTQTHVLKPSRSNRGNNGQENSPAT